MICPIDSDCLHRELIKSKYENSPMIEGIVGTDCKEDTTILMKKAMINSYLFVNLLKNEVNDVLEKSLGMCRMLEYKNVKMMVMVPMRYQGKMQVGKA